jgi:hypothetical protein
VSSVKLDDFVLEVLSVIWCKFKLFKIVAAHGLGVVIAQFRLDEVRTEQGVSNERTRQTIGQNIVADLKTELVTSDVFLKLRGVWGVEFNFERKLPRLRCKHPI